MLGGLENGGISLRLALCARSRVRTAELFETLLSRSCLWCSCLIDVYDHGGTYPSHPVKPRLCFLINLLVIHDPGVFIAS